MLGFFDVKIVVFKGVMIVLKVFKYVFLVKKRLFFNDFMFFVFISLI